MPANVADMDNQDCLKDKGGQIGEEKYFDIGQQQVGKSFAPVDEHSAEGNPEKPAAEKNADSDIVAFERGYELSENKCLGGD